MSGSDLPRLKGRGTQRRDLVKAAVVSPFVLSTAWTLHAEPVPHSLDHFRNAFRAFDLRPIAGTVHLPSAAGSGSSRLLTTEEKDHPGTTYLLSPRGLAVVQRPAADVLAESQSGHASAGDLDKIELHRLMLLSSFVEALFGEAPLAASAAEICERANTWVSLLPADSRTEVTLGALLIELVLGTDFSSLSIADRQSRITARLGHAAFAPLRQLGRLRMVYYSSYYAIPKTWPGLGFVPPDQRPGAPPFSTVRELNCANISNGDKFDWIVIGSGAGGGAAAAALAAKGKSVAVLEKGEYWPVSRLKDHDADQIAQIYVGGGLNTTQDGSIAVLQGSSVGGSTLINNAICFRLSEPGWTHPDAPDVLAHWRDQYGVSIDPSKLEAAYEFVESRLEVAPIGNDILGPNGAHLLKAWKSFLGSGKASPGDLQAPYRNFKKNYGTGARACLGCGYCNSGCPYYRKNSTAQTFLADAERAGARIIPGCEVLRVKSRDDGRARTARSVSVLYKGLDAEIECLEGVIVAAGVGASTELLRASGVDGAGFHISCNLACPVVAHLRSRTSAWRGVQMGSYVDRGTHILEAWFHPPETFSASVGGWFGEYLRRINGYDQLVCISVVMPTDPTGTYDEKINLTLSQSQLDSLREYIVEVIHLHFIGDADEVYLPSSQSVTVRPGDDVKAIVSKYLQEQSDFILSTAHPQGGNPMGREDDLDSVVGADLSVHGFSNMFVADASVFPSCIRVNPQLTIMALAHSRFA